MSQPPPYVPAHSFVADSATVPNFPGQALDVEFNNVKTTTDAVRTNLARIQRDDGALLNSAVGYDQLSAALQTAGLAPANAWLTATTYLLGANAIQNGNLYRSTVTHTSNVFATDLAAGKWFFVAALPVAPQVSGLVKMWPTSAGQTSGAWNVVDPYGNAISTASTTTQGLQEAYNAAVASHWGLLVDGPGISSGASTALITLGSTWTLSGSHQIYVQIRNVSITSNGTLGTAPVIDIQVLENSFIDLQAIISQHPSDTGPVVRFSAPLVPTTSMDASTIRVNDIVPSTGGYGVLFDVTNAGINGNSFEFVDINGGTHAVKVTGSRTFYGNVIKGYDWHGQTTGTVNTGPSIGIAQQNTWAVSLSRPTNVTTAWDMYGVGDTINSYISTELGTITNGIKFNPGATGNFVQATFNNPTNFIVDGNSGNKVSYNTTNAFGTITETLNGSPVTTAAVTQTLTNKTLTSPTINNATITTSALTALGAASLSPANNNITIAPTGTGQAIINPSTAGTMDNVAVGGTTPLAGAFTTLTARAGSSTTNLPLAGLVGKNTTPTGNTAATTEDILQSFSLPANAFASNGQKVRIKAYGTYGANVDNKTIKVYFGAQIYNTGVITQNGTSWTFEADVWRTGASTQGYGVQGILAGNSIVGAGTGTLSQTDTGAITIKVTGQSNTATANNIICTAMFVEFYN